MRVFSLSLMRRPNLGFGRPLAFAGAVLHRSPTLASFLASIVQASDCSTSPQVFLRSDLGFSKANLCLGVERRGRDFKDPIKTWDPGSFAWKTPSFISLQEVTCASHLLVKAGFHVWDPGLAMVKLKLWEVMEKARRRRWRLTEAAVVSRLVDCLCWSGLLGRSAMVMRHWGRDFWRRPWVPIPSWDRRVWTRAEKGWADKGWALRVRLVHSWARLCWRPNRCCVRIWDPGVQDPY